MQDILTKENISLYTAKHYDNPHCCSDEEYLKDLKTIKYIKVLLNKVHRGDSINYRILLNHFILLSNIFPGVSFPTLCFFHFEERSWNIIVPILLFLSRMPKTVKSVSGRTLCVSDISLDTKMINILRSL